MPKYRMRQCKHSNCGFRYPAAEGDSQAGLCPRCGRPTSPVRVRNEPYAPRMPRAGISAHIEVLMDNIRSVYNVGSLFRTANGAGVRHVHLCGITASPEQPKLAKTALGAEGPMGWTYYPNGLLAARSLKRQGYSLWALEDTHAAKELYADDGFPEYARILLIVGNEKMGVDPQILELCDRIIRIPMLGTKDSLNVAVAFGIALYHLVFVGMHPTGASRL